MGKAIRSLGAGVGVTDPKIDEFRQMKFEMKTSRKSGTKFG